MDEIINIFRNIIKKSTSFRGRINRHQYWLFLFTMLLIAAITIWFTEKIPVLHLVEVYGILMILPYISSTVKRLHDLNKSGWWFLCFFLPVLGWIYLFILTIENGKETTNHYGTSQDWSNYK